MLCCGGCGALLKGGLDLDQLERTTYVLTISIAKTARCGSYRRTSSFFFSPFSPKSFNCPSTRFLWVDREYTPLDSSEEHAHLALDEVEAGIDVLARLGLVLLHEHGPDELVDGVVRGKRRKLLCITRW